MPDNEKLEEALEKVEETPSEIEELPEPSEAELEAVAGGETTCIMVGLSDGVEAEGEADQYYACAILGFSFGL